MTPGRNEVVHFSPVLKFTSGRITYKNLKIGPNVLGFINPFTPEVNLSKRILFIKFIISSTYGLTI